MPAEEWVDVQVRMQGAQRFISEARAAGASIRMLGTESKYTGQQFHYMGGRGFWANQAFFTLRRTIYGLTLGIGGLAAVAIRSGFAFNSMVEQQTLAFTRFTGSIEGAHKEVKFLFDLAAHGPFEFQQVIQASRQLQAFGFDVKSANQLLFDLQDAMAGMGLDQAALDRATLALGQIRSSGRLLGQDLRQLEQLGLVNPEDFARRLRIPVAALSNVGALNIPSKLAIDTIVAYWKSRFSGAAKDFQKTWVGEISTLKDIGRQTFGAMVLPLQQRLEKNVIPDITKMAIAAQKGFKQGGMEGFFKAIDQSVGHGVNFTRTYRTARDLIIQIIGIVTPFAMGFLFALHVLKPFNNVGFVLIGVLHAVASVLGFISPILGPLITLWIAERTAMLLVVAATKSLIFWEILQTAWTKRKVFWTNLATASTNLNTGATKLNTRALVASFFATEAVWTQQGVFHTKTTQLKNPLARYTAQLWKAAAAQTGLTLATLGWVGAVVAVAGILVILYFKWRAFHNLINRTANYLYNHWQILALIPVFGPFAAGAVIMAHHFDTLVGWLKAIVRWARRAGDALGDLWNKVPGHSWLGKALSWGSGWGEISTLGGWMGLAGGGNVTMGGVFDVGEHGRERVFLPRGAAVRPMPALPALASGHGGPHGGFPSELTLHVPLYIDGRKVAESSSKHKLDKLARQ